MHSRENRNVISNSVRKYLDIIFGAEIIRHTCFFMYSIFFFEILQSTSWTKPLPWVIIIICLWNRTFLLIQHSAILGTYWSVIKCWDSYLALAMYLPNCKHSIKTSIYKTVFYYTQKLIASTLSKWQFYLQLSFSNLFSKKNVYVSHYKSNSTTKLSQTQN